MKYFQFKSTLIIVLCSFSFSSCFQQNKQNSLTIPKLQKIGQSPKGHYKTLSEYSAKVNPVNKQLDEIKFPEKAYQVLVKIISPAYLSRDEIDSLIKTLQHPANSSQQTKAELDFLLELQNTRTPEQVAEALRLHDIVWNLT